jgi:hypothetical protein
MRWLLLALAISACGKSDDAKPAEPAEKPHHRQDRHDPQEAPGKLALTIVVGDAKSSWGPEAFAAVPQLAGKATDGEARDTWSLRELVQKNLGPTARVTAVEGADGKKPIAEADWNDAARTPILHTTRRGTLKFRWADKDGKWGETEVKDVVGLELSAH